MPIFSSAVGLGRGAFLPDTVADKQHFDFLLESIAQVRDVRGGDAVAAEHADVREFVEVGQRDLFGLHAAHR